MVPPRPAPGRQPGPARRLRHATACCRCSCSTPPCGGRPGISRQVVPRRGRCAPSTPRCGSGGAGLSVVRGDPVREVVRAAQEVGASRVHVAADYGPYGRRRDLDVEQALADAGIELVRTGSPYAVAPDRVKNGSGDPYQVYTPFSRAWLEHGWRDPVDAPTGATWLALDDTVDVPDPELPDGLELPEAGEDGGPDGVGGVRRGAPRRLRRRAGPARPGRHQPHVGAPEVGRDPPAHDAGRPQGPHRQGRGRPTAASWPSASSTPTCCSQRPDTARDYLRPEFAADGVRRAGRRSSTPGGRAAPASRSWTPACASCGRPAGCTTGSG